MTTKKEWIYISVHITVSDKEQHYYSTELKGEAQQDFTLPLIAKNAIDYTTIIQEVVNIAIEDFRTQ